MRAALGVLVDLLSAMRAVDRRLVVLVALPRVLVIVPLVLFRIAARHAGALTASKTRARPAHRRCRALPALTESFPIGYRRRESPFCDGRNRARWRAAPRLPPAGLPTPA